MLVSKHSEVHAVKRNLEPESDMETNSFRMLANIHLEN